MVPTAEVRPVGPESWRGLPLSLYFIKRPVERQRDRNPALAVPSPVCYTARGVPRCLPVRGPVMPPLDPVPPPPTARVRVDLGPRSYEVAVVSGDVDGFVPFALDALRRSWAGASCRRRSTSNRFSSTFFVL